MKIYPDTASWNEDKQKMRPAELDRQAVYEMSVISVLDQESEPRELE